MIRTAYSLILTVLTVILVVRGGEVGEVFIFLPLLLTYPLSLLIKHRGYVLGTVLVLMYNIAFGGFTLSEVLAPIVLVGGALLVIYSAYDKHRVKAGRKIINDRQSRKAYKNRYK